MGKSRFAVQAAGAYLLFRLMTLALQPFEAIFAYGDWGLFHALARMGLPFIDYWSEYPPLFPFISSLAFWAGGGEEHVYVYLLALALALGSALSIFAFAKLSEEVFSTREDARNRTMFYMFFVMGLSFGWLYFDQVTVALSLVAILLTWGRKDVIAGMALGLGILTKWFPALLFPILVKKLNWRRLLKIALVGLGLTALVLGALYLASPEMTRASLLANAKKSSWGTVWALLDRNVATGNFGPIWERLDPNAAEKPLGNSPVVSPALTLLSFGILGFWFFRKFRLTNEKKFFGFWGLTWCLFLLWSPGFSPQWIVNLLPMIFLALPIRRAFLFGAALCLVEISGWPVILSRGWFDLLWIPVTVRTLVLALLALDFLRASGIEIRKSTK